MEKLTLERVAGFARGTVLGNPRFEVSAVQIDSRKLTPGDLFIALKGERADGHSFVNNALEKGAAAMVQRNWAEQNGENRNLIAVEDTLKGLQELAGTYRNRFDIPVVGVTGSSGKTTTKDMIAAVLGGKFPVHKTSGNFNNELGLPLTLLGLDSTHRAAVVEMGMRGLGEIAFLASLAKPKVGVITNIGTTHMELLGSQENIARAKGELLEALPEDGIAVLNWDDAWSKRLGAKLSCKVISYSLKDQGADLLARDLKPWGEQGTSFSVVYHDEHQEVFLPVPGRHNVANALAAIGAGLSLGLGLADCAQGLRELQLTGMRLEIVTGPRGSRIINDSYNANPGSTIASLEVLAERDAPRVAVLGSMFELGSEEENGHKQVGAVAAGTDLYQLITVGELGRYIAQGAKDAGLGQDRIFSFATTAEAVEHLKRNLPQGAWVLVKGSRGMKMEKVVEGLLT